MTPFLADKSASNPNKGTRIISGVVSAREELAKELQKPIVGKFKNRKVHSSFIDNICGKVKNELRVTSSNPRVTSSKPRVTSSNP